MKENHSSFFLSIFLFLCFELPVFSKVNSQFQSLSDYCFTQLSSFPGEYSKENLKKACHTSALLNSCYSQVAKKPILHFDKFGTHSAGKRILVFGLFHGDETPAGSVGRHWVTRLKEISPRSTWRVVPVVNPDGVKALTRVNARKVDLNRNFPTRNWETLATSNWEKKERKNPRRFPGEKSNSEQEVKCVINHIENFKPDLIISLHTPYGLLDFDGPQKQLVEGVIGLPAKSLGHYPGSLGRYMWAERKTPVLTIELKGNKFNLSSPQLDELQDSIGSMALKISQ